MRLIARASLLVLLAAGAIQGQQPASQAGNTGIGGTVVNGASGRPEAGVWVIAETRSLPTPFRKIVVTDDQGRFLLPDLPAASYEVWVRGYGLKDSVKTAAVRGAQLRLQAADASSPAEAARIYPAAYWASLIQPPASDQLPADYRGSQDHWLAELRACNQCHQLGMTATRLYTNPAQWDKLLALNSGMNSAANELGRELLTKTLADWVSRIRAGQVPQVPARPAGIERNFVVTQWDWGGPASFVHDNVSTDKRNPTLYPYGKVFGADRMYGGRLLVLDPLKHTVDTLQIGTRDKTKYNAGIDYYHDRAEPGTWMASPHNPMMDDQGRVWMTVPIRPGGVENNPRWLKDAIVTESMDPREIDLAHRALSARGNGMHLGFYDTKSGTFGQVDTAFPTHHLQFDWQGRLWTDAGTIGTLDLTRLDFNDIQGTEGAAQKAWMRVDAATGNVRPSGGYGITVSPVDGTVFVSVSTTNGPENKIWKIDPATRTMTDYLLPPPGRLPHGIDHSTNGSVWFSAGSGHLGRFDPKAEKFTYWELPGPRYPGTGAETGSTEYPYFLWVDQFDALGMGKDTVIVTGTSSDALFMFDPRTERFVAFRMPYPLPFFTRGLDGRIDDPAAGWKGRGIWASYNSYLPRFSETRIGHISHIQLRPNPLAN